MQDWSSPYPRLEQGPPPVPPPVIVWYKVYCGFMAGLYLLCAVFMLAFPSWLTSALRSSPSSARNAREIQDLEAMLPFWIVMALIFVVFAAPFLMAIFMRRATWHWVFGIVLIALGMTSICTLPFCIPLLIFWLKDDVKYYYSSAAS
jgi:hypothetical protein